MTTISPVNHEQTANDVIDALHSANGVHPGFRPAHAKGILVRGIFRPAYEARSVTCAPHMQDSEIPVTVRFSDFAGFPAVADANGSAASPRGCAIRFQLGEHKHTDIVAHSVDAFPTRTAEEFAEFMRAVGASGPAAMKPTPIEKFLSRNRAALAFVQAPKPIPVSFARECYFAVNAYKFTTALGSVRCGRFRIRPEDGALYLAEAQLAGMRADFLADEMKASLLRAPCRLLISVQVAESSDVTDDSTVRWPEDRLNVRLGTVELREFVDNSGPEQQHIIFDPVPRIPGIEPSGDPLIEDRAATYLISGRRRRGEAV
jgi:catalase